MSEQKIEPQYQCVCTDHGPKAFQGKAHAQKYRAEQEMWKHRNVGHVHATVAIVIQNLRIVEKPD